MINFSKILKLKNFIITKKYIYAHSSSDIFVSHYSWMTENDLAHLKSHSFIYLRNHSKTFCSIVCFSLSINQSSICSFDISINYSITHSITKSIICSAHCLVSQSSLKYFFIYCLSAASNATSALRSSPQRRKDSPWRNCGVVVGLIRVVERCDACKYHYLFD